MLRDAEIRAAAAAQDASAVLVFLLLLCYLAVPCATFGCWVPPVPGENRAFNSVICLRLPALRPTGGLFLSLARCSLSLGLRQRAHTHASARTHTHAFTLSLTHLHYLTRRPSDAGSSRQSASSESARRPWQAIVFQEYLDW
jgi:hypothetical protein